MKPGGLSPLGTARLLVSGADAARFPRELKPPAREHDLGEESLFLAWELVSYARGLGPEDERALLVLVLASMVSVHQGSTRLPLADPERATYLAPLYRALGGADAGLERAIALLAHPALVPLVGAPGDYKPLIVDGGWLYHQRMLSCEDRLVAALKPRLGTASLAAPDLIDRALADVLARPAVQRGKTVELSAEQQRAVCSALAGRLTVISGGPGTGKTSIVASILRVLARLDVPLESVALAAPTGKAAFRMRESIERSLASIVDPAPIDRAITCPEARTLHRLLGYSPRGSRFSHHENNRLSERVVIVDEGSMIDLYLMDQLARSVRDDAILIVLGDADQLPSVDAGAVFRDLLPCVPSGVRLTESYRMDPVDPAGRNVLSVAREIQAGVTPTGTTLRASAAELAFEKVETLDGSRAAFVERWFRERVHGLDGFDELWRRPYRLGPEGFDEADRRDLDRLFDHFERFRILCVTRSEYASTGAAHLNALLHRKALAHAHAIGDAPADARHPLYPGEPVLMLHNDYARGLFNGDQGLVMRVSMGDSPRAAGHPLTMVVFPRRPGGYAVFHLDALRPQIQLSYAMTIHKSQGSEFDHVAVVLPDEDLALLTRELLYTAVTRSRRSVVLLGHRPLFDAGVARQIRRFSGIADKLGGPRPSPPPPASKPAKNPNQLKLPF